MRRGQLWLIALAAIAPRLAVLLHERGRILTAFTDKSDDFAQTFVHHGTFGFIPGEPSAYTQPLYGFFLIPIYWIFGRNWWAVGGAQIAVATVTALLVYAIGARVLSRRAGTIAAILATLNPYLVWHDVHLNREVLDQLVAAAFILCTLVAADRRSVKWATAAGLFGGLAVLGNVRLIFIPLVVAAYLRDPQRLELGARRTRRRRLRSTVTPWVVRNKVEVGCFALTTDGRALWKANNEQTYGLLAQGKWIDDVKDPPGPSVPEPRGGARHLPAERQEDPRRRVCEPGLLPAQGLASSCVTIPARRRSSLRRPCAWSGIRAPPPPRRTRATERSAAWRSRSTPRSCTRSRSSASSSLRAGSSASQSPCSPTRHSPQWRS